MINVEYYLCKVPSFVSPSISHSVISFSSISSQSVTGVSLISAAHQLIHLCSVSFVNTEIVKRECETPADSGYVTLSHTLVCHHDQ